MRTVLPSSPRTLGPAASAQVMEASGGAGGAFLKGEETRLVRRGGCGLVPGAGVSFLGHQDRLTPQVKSHLVSLHLRSSHPRSPLSGSRPPVWTLATHSHVSFTAPGVPATAPMCSPPSHPTLVRAEPWRAGRRIRFYLSFLRASCLYGLGSYGIRKSNSLVII